MVKPAQCSSSSKERGAEFHWLPASLLVALTALAGTKEVSMFKIPS